jgi:hypothetical protein
MGRERSLVLTEADRARLQGWSRRRKTAGPGTALTHHPTLEAQFIRQHNAHRRAPSGYVNDLAVGCINLS